MLECDRIRLLYMMKMAVGEDVKELAEIYGEEVQKVHDNLSIPLPLGHYVPTGSYFEGTPRKKRRRGVPHGLDLPKLQEDRQRELEEKRRWLRRDT